MIQQLLLLLQLLVVVVASSSSFAYAQQSFNVVQNAQSLESKLKEYGNAVLGFSAIQQEFLQLQTEVSNGLSGNELLNQISTKTVSLIQSRMKIAQEIVNQVQMLYSTSKENQQKNLCCEQTEVGIPYQYRFRGKVHLNEACLRLPEGFDANKDSFSKRDIDVSNALRPYLASIIAKTETLKWTYFGSNRGVFTISPAFLADSCTSYDNRFRPWFVAASTKPKVVILVIDSSGSMSAVSRMDTAKRAAKAVLDTLNPNDFVQVVDFDSFAATPSGYISEDQCSIGRLVLRATPQAVNTLSSFIDSLESSGSTNFQAAFDKAYTVLSDSRNQFPEINSLPTAIIFMTDGEADRPILRPPSINPPIIFAFAFGEGVGSETIRMLSQVATSTGGVFNVVPDGSGSQLRTSMGSYYTHPAFAAESTSPIITVPYIDFDGLGVVVTIAASVQFGGTNLGVVGVDLTLTEILENANNLLQKGKSFVIIVDGKGRVLSHPNLPLPHAVNSDPVFVTLDVLESNPTLKELVNGVRLGTNGSLRVENLPRFLSRGAGNEGTVQVFVNGTFFWNRLPIDASNFMSFAIFVSDEDSQTVTKLAPIDPDPSKRSLFNEFKTLEDKNIKVKNQYWRELATEKSSMFFAARLYRDPSRFLEGSAFSKAQVESIEQYINQDPTSVTNSLLETEAQTDSRASFKAETTWLSQSSEIGAANPDKVIWRYLGTVNGAYRIFPGGPSIRFYDPILRPWFLRALRKPSEFAVSHPYEDAAGAGIVLTLSKALMISNSTDPYAVMGVDFSVPKFKELVEESLPFCKNREARCFLVDAHSYVVYDSKQEIKTSVPLGALLPSVMKSLVHNKVYESQGCNNFGFGQEERHFTLGNVVGQLASPGGLFNSFDTCGDPISMTKLSGINLYLLVTDKNAKEKGCDDAVCSVLKDDGSYSLSNCTFATPSLGEVCPCYQELVFSPCKGSYALNSRQASLSVCAAPPPPVEDENTSPLIPGWLIAIIVIASILFLVGLMFMCGCFKCNDCDCCAGVCQSRPPSSSSANKKNTQWYASCCCCHRCSTRRSNKNNLPEAETHIPGPNTLREVENIPEATTVQFDSDDNNKRQVTLF